MMMIESLNANIISSFKVAGNLLYDATCLSDRIGFSAMHGY